MLRSRDIRQSPGRNSFLLVGFGILLATILPCHAWRSSLYPESWTPPETASFSSDRLIQDFSYAGYQRGDLPVPEVAGPVFDAVADHGADPTGTTDSTAAIQAAIDAAAGAGGGVVFLQAGTYHVAPSGGNNFALRIDASDVILRGAGVSQTFILNTSYEMRGSKVLLVAPPSTTPGGEVAITVDLDQPTRRIPVADPSAFGVGDIVRIEWTFTQDWIDEHQQESWWSAPDTVPSPAEYLRNITAVDSGAGWIEVDVPTRYTIKTRDDARVRTIDGQLSGVGIEDISLGNAQHPGTEWGEGDYTTPGNAAYDAHASWLISMEDVRDSWITRVESFQAAGNTPSGCHMLSNGVRLLRSFRITVADCTMRRSQYGGGGGNGYMFRIQSSHENLIRDSIADFSRHGFVISHAGTSGNVFLRCEDRETGRSTGSSGSYNTNGSGSDHHMHFPHSNLFDQCHVHNSFYTAHHRGNSGTVPHGLTSAHGVYWNTSGSGSRGGAVVRSEQARYGYVIGTSGDRASASNPTGGNTSPTDLLEGIGIGGTLEPASLYLDQVSRRMEGILITMAEDANIPPTSAHPLTPSAYSYATGPVSYQWSQVSGPPAVFADSSSLQTTVELLDEGIYELDLTVDDGARSASAQVIITVDDSIVLPTVTTVMHGSVDAIVGRRQDNASPLGYYEDDSGNIIGSTGSNAGLTREDRNLVLGYTLPDLPAGSTLAEATLHFEITAYRNHSGADPGLDVYLLDSTTPQDTGSTFFFHGETDPNPDTIRVGGTDLSAAQGGQVDYPSATHVQAYTLSGAALARLQDFYGGDHLPDQPEVFFRFNLDNLVSGGGNGDLGGSSLDRYRIDVGAGATSLAFSSLPDTTTFGDWVTGFDLAPDQQGVDDDPDGDGIPNAVENFLGTHPGEPSQGLSIVAAGNGSLTLTHPRNPEPATDLTAAYRWSTNLVDYHGDGETDANGTSVTLTPSTENDITTVDAVVGGTPAGRLFVVIEVNVN